MTVAHRVAGGHHSAAARTGVLRARRRKDGIIAWLFALPFTVVFALFMLVPLLSSLGMAFTDFTSRDVRNPFAVGFTGLGQFAHIIEDPRFLKAMLNTGYFVIVGIPLTMAVGLLLALALNSGIDRFRTFFRVGFYAPVVTSIVAIAVVWRFILQQDGLLNTMLSWLGIAGPDWLNSTAWAMPSMIMMAVWRNMGTLMIIFLAGLQAIPRDALEAAEVDGANAWQRFTQITLPLLRPTLLLGAVMLSVGFLQFFEEPFVMTKGGPLDSTLSISYYIYNEFGFGEYGVASAASYVLFIAIALLSLLQFRLLRRKD